MGVGVALSLLPIVTSSIFLLQTKQKAVTRLVLDRLGINTETTSAVNDNVNDNDPEMGFLEAVIRHVFGVGDPNRERNSKQLQLASAMIRENNGVVTAQQLAPFCDAPPPGGDGDEQLHVDESFVLPIVSKLYGVPSVTDDGNIVYTFSELQTSAQTMAEFDKKLLASDEPRNKYQMLVGAFGNPMRRLLFFAKQSV